MTKLFRSVRFNIFLGAAITLAAAVGTLIPQLGEAPEKAAAFQGAHPQWSRLFDFFGFFDLYHAWWFMGLLGLMALDIVLCQLWSPPPQFACEEEASSRSSRKEATLRRNPHQALFASRLPLERAFAQAQRGLAAQGYRIAADFATPAGAAFVATKHGLQRWGSYLAHIAFVVILAGALVKGIFGFVEMVPVMEGRSQALQHKPQWELFVDKFSVKYYDGTREPKDFASRLRVKQGGALLAQKTIRVNAPLDIQGVRFYQATWGAGGDFRSVTLKAGDKIVLT